MVCSFLFFFGMKRANESDYFTHCDRLVRQIRTCVCHHCNVLYLWRYIYIIENFYYFLSFFPLHFQSQFHKIYPFYINGPFCPSVLCVAMLPVKIVPEMAYCMSGGMLNPTHSLAIYSLMIRIHYILLCITYGH